MLDGQVMCGARHDVALPVADVGQSLALFWQSEYVLLPHQKQGLCEVGVRVRVGVSVSVRVRVWVRVRVRVRVKVRVRCRG